MVQEYLFIDNEKRSEVEEYRPEKVTAETQGIENTECWIATYFVPGENEEGANLLSKVNEYIMSNYQPTVLSNGCAAYYNKSLFPFINEFERKLRKLLYLKSALNKGDEAAATICQCYCRTFTSPNHGKSNRGSCDSFICNLYTVHITISAKSSSNIGRFEDIGSGHPCINESSRGCFKN